MRAEQDGWLAERIAASRDAVSLASRVVAAGGRSNDACLRARRGLEHGIGLRTAGVTATAADYLDAARRLEDAGLGAHAETLRAIADTEAELQAARQQWAARRAARPESPAERAAAQWIEDGLVLLAGPYAEGVDGCYYGLSRLRGELLLPGECAVTVITSARHPQVVAGFEDIDHVRMWLADRTRQADRPLAACRIPPDCRVSREERLLAGLLGQPARVLEDFGTSVSTWTSDLRAEIFLAWRSAAPSSGRRPAPEALAAELDRRMLRAPEDASRVMGPAGWLAMSYLQRLAVTQVSAGQAATAARDLREEDARAAAQARGVQPEPAAQARTATSSPVQYQPPPAPGRSGLLPRL